MSAEAGPKPQITKAVARGDLTSVRKIVESAAAISNDEKIKTINHARKWTEHNYAKTEENPNGTTEWYDVTPLTVAAMRGHDAIVEYLLEQGADPTLKGCPKDDIEMSNDVGLPLIDLPALHMNAIDGMSGLTRKIRCCRRTQDLLMVVKPYWKRSVYSGSSAVRHKRTIYSNSPLNMKWVRDAIREVPKLQDYPLKAKNFSDDMIDSEYYWKKRKREDEMQNDANKVLPPQPEEAVDVGCHRRCFSCGELKPDYSYNKNERKKGVEARCISCVATNPAALDLPTCPICKMPKLNDDDTVCQPCMVRMANESKKPSAMKLEPE